MRIFCFISKKRLSGESVEYNYREQSESGEEWYELTYTPVKNERGVVHSVVFGLENLTDKKNCIRRSGTGKAELRSGCQYDNGSNF